MSDVTGSIHPFRLGEEGVGEQDSIHKDVIFLPRKKLVQKLEKAANTQRRFLRRHTNWEGRVSVRLSQRTFSCLIFAGGADGVPRGC